MASASLPQGAAGGGPVLVVGASRGIGLSFAMQYLAAGHAVVATARAVDACQRLSDAGARTLLLDVTDAASVAGFLDELGHQAFGTVILNAGVYGPRSAGLETPTVADFDHVMHTNVLGPMRLIPTLADHLAPGARLAVLSSRMGSIGTRSSSSGWLYRASKAALNSVLKDTAVQLAGRAVCVAFHPGWVRTDMGGSQADLDVARSVADMRAVIERLNPHDSGSFLNHDGQPIAW